MPFASQRTTTVAPRPRPWIFRMGFFVLAFGALLMYLGSLANGPDQELVFSRDVPSDLAPIQLAAALDQVQSWPSWFFSATSAVILDENGAPSSDEKLKLVPGKTVIRLTIDPKGNHRHNFDLTLKVLDYVPGRKVSLRVIGDTTNRLTRLFSPLDWTVEISREAPGGSHVTAIHGAAIARTHNWRSRLFGKIANRTLMNQVFYPDLMGLASYGTQKPLDLFPSGS